MNINGILHSIIEQLRQWIQPRRNYLLSLPERSARSTAAFVGGMSFLLTDTLLPKTMRETAFYRAFVGNIQRYIAHRIGDAPLADSELITFSGAEIGDDFVQRKMVGNTLEIAGLLAMRVSPIWVFALATDAVAGGAVFVDRLADHLRRNGVIEADATPDDLTEVLGAMEQALRTTAAPIDTPPLSRADLTEMTNELVASYDNVFQKGGALLPEFEAVWQRMNQLAQQENISLERLSGIMTVDALRHNLAALGQTGVDVSHALGTTSAELFDETILDSYRQTLDTIAVQGVPNYVGTTLRPFLTTAASHFDPTRSTWTERWLGHPQN